MGEDTGKKVRTDARRNRERLVEAARHAFTTQGDTVALETIARAAGVGIGTLYRHFPSREALVEAVYRAERTRLCESAAELLASLPPDRALRGWMDNFGDYMALKRDLADALRAAISSGAITRSQAQEELAAAVQTLLDAGAKAGTTRSDVPARDVVVGILGVFLACGPDQRDQAGRLLDLLMDGLRPR